MFGAIIGDIIGSPYEFEATKDKDFDFYPLNRKINSKFTDDTVLTIAVAHSLMTGKPYVDSFHYFVKKEPKRGYGSKFGLWVQTGDKKPYNSFGNGSAMRVSPIAHYFNTEKDVLDEAKKSADVTHNHPEGVKGAQSVALAVFMARNGASKTDIKKEIIKRFGYDLNRTWAEIDLLYSFDVTCQGSVPEAIICFLASTDFEDAIRNAVALGGDADTQACIAGSIAEAFYGGVPSHHKEIAINMLSPELRDIALNFEIKYINPKRKI